MSGILAFVGAAGSDRVRAALDRLAWLGGDLGQVRSADGATIAVTRKDWEAHGDHAGPVTVIETDDLLVAADASVYDRAGLIRALAQRRVAPTGLTASHLIEAAYRAWGADLARHLVGDYAFAIWDRRAHRLLAARDPIGMRPLYLADLGAGIAVSSSSAALAILRGRSDALDMACLGGQVAGLIWGNGTATAFDGVAPLPAGHRLLASEAGHDLARFWLPPEAPATRPTDKDAAALELRELLVTAVRDRMGDGVTSVWMSGGWDSTAAFGAGQSALPDGQRHRLRPVSISYPVGDPGREDELIAQVASHWKAEVHWIPSHTIPLVEGLAERAALTDEPPAHAYELWNRELARGSRAVGARIGLDGCGGDNLFQVSDVILADLLRHGHLAEFSRQAWSRRQFGWRYLARSGVLPLLPDVLVRTAEQVTGHRIPRHYMEHPPVPWVRRDFIAAHGLREQALATLRSERAPSLAQTENILYVTAPAWGWAGGYMRGMLLQEGVEARSPLLDLRIVEFALKRPVSERFAGAETKILLRRAMDGLLPAPVLAPRARRTGSTAGFSRRRMREEYPALLRALFAEPLRLADLGVVDPAALRAAADRWTAGDDGPRMGLLDTMRVEFWLRGRQGREPAAARRPRVELALAGVSAA